MTTAQAFEVVKGTGVETFCISLSIWKYGSDDKPDIRWSIWDGNDRTQQLATLEDAVRDLLKSHRTAGDMLSETDAQISEPIVNPPTP